MRFLIMALMFLAGAVATGLVGPNRGAVQAEFGLSYTQFAVGLSAIQITISVSLLLAAGWLGRIRPDRLMRAALAIVALGLCLVGLTRHVGLLMLGWAITVAGTGLTAITNNLSMDLWPHHPRQGVVLLHAFNALGKWVGPLIAAAFVAVAWRRSFLAMALVPLGLLAVSWVRHGTRPVPMPSPAEALQRDRDTLRLPLYWLALACFGMIAGGEAAFATLMPSYFHHVRGLSQPAAAGLLSIHLAGLVAGRFIVAWWGHRLSNNQIIGWCLAAGLGIAPILLSSDAAPVGVAVRSGGLFVLGAMFSSTWPTFYAQAVSHLPGHRDLLAYGAILGSVVGITLCLVLSSAVADLDLTASMLFGPAVLWAFGGVYVLSRLSRPAPVALAARAPLGQDQG